MRRLIAVSALLLGLVACEAGKAPTSGVDTTTTVSSSVKIEMDGRPMDLNGDGVIAGDIEMGA